MSGSFLLSLGFFAFLSIVIATALRLAPFRFRANGLPDISRRLFFSISFASAALCAAAAFLIINYGSAAWLQGLYFFLFLAGLALNIFVLSDHPAVRWLFGFVGSAALAAFLLSGSVWSQNLVMALGLLCVGPALVQRLRVRTLYLTIILAAGALLDAYLVWLAPARPGLDDSALALNGMIASGDFSLGLGDFAFASLAIALLVRERPLATAWTAAFLIAFIRFGLRAVFPELGDIPYLVIVSLVTLAFLACTPRRLRETARGAA